MESLTTAFSILARIVLHLLRTKEVYTENVFVRCEAEAQKSRLRKHAAQFGFQIIPADRDRGEPTLKGGAGCVGGERLQEIEQQKRRG